MWQWWALGRTFFPFVNMKWREAMHSCMETLNRLGKSVLSFFAKTIRAARTGSSYPVIV